MKDDVFSFEDFLNNEGNVNINDKKVDESIKDEETYDIESITKSPEPKKEVELVDTKKDSIEKEVEMGVDIEDFVIDNKSESIDDNFYKLYKDINEEFICDIAIEGSTPDETFARIIIESDEWSLIFPGTIENGKCIVPIKKLGIFKEGQIGNIKLEVVAEGNLFVPWQDKYKVKLSKKVIVNNMNENKQAIKQQNNNGVNVKVNMKK
jgi:hypothetical protein